MAIQEVKAMLPGVFYRKPAPDQPNYKNEGDTINKGDVLGLIEVMKSFHPVVCEYSGRVRAFRAENEAAIAPGDVLAEIEEG